MLNEIIIISAIIFSQIIIYFLFVKPLQIQNKNQVEMINAKTSAEYQSYQIQKMKFEESDTYKDLLRAVDELKKENQLLRGERYKK
ncbi:MAG TPA: hypothetical protein PKY81_17295 [bacterium]|nr:hypothetical protein [bacterium]